MCARRLQFPYVSSNAVSQRGRNASTNFGAVPAVYYAHLASNRARAHEDISSSLGPHTNKEEQKMKLQSANSSEKPPTEFPPLLPMDNANGIQFTMWYI